jgi:hypothetical protein
MIMRATIGALCLVAAATTIAHGDVAGVYAIKFEEVSTNCSAPLRYPNGKLTIRVKGSSLTVDLERTPLMTGTVSSKASAISAKSKQGNTMIEGMRGVFSVAGKVTPEGLLQLVMIGEYSANGKPLCTQSWNVFGPKLDEKPTK